MENSNSSNLEEQPAEAAGGVDAEPAETNKPDKRSSIIRWRICATSLHFHIAEQLRRCVSNKMKKEFVELKSSHHIDNQILEKHYNHPLNYKLINNNGNKIKYTAKYDIKDEVELSKLFLDDEYIAKYPTFDACEMSALLTITIRTAQSEEIKDRAKKMRDMRNDLSHPIARSWDEKKFDEFFDVGMQFYDALLGETSGEAKEELEKCKTNGMGFIAGTADDDAVNEIHREFEELKKFLTKQQSAIIKRDSEIYRYFTRMLENVEQGMAEFRDDVNENMKRLSLTVANLTEEVRLANSSNPCSASFNAAPSFNPLSASLNPLSASLNPLSAASNPSMELWQEKLISEMGHNDSHNLGVLLSILQPDGKDWRSLADELQLSISYITLWEQQGTGSKCVLQKLQSKGWTYGDLYAWAKRNERQDIMDQLENERHI